MLEETRVGGRIVHRARVPGRVPLCLPWAPEGKRRATGQASGIQEGFRGDLSLPCPQGGLAAAPRTMGLSGLNSS